MNRLFAALVVACAMMAQSAVAADSPSLDPQLEPLRPLLEKTWKGPFVGAKADKPIVDVMRWERALNGKAVRVLHSINDGVYGGETIFMWNDKKQELGYHYFSTAGFMTVGTMRFKDGKWISQEVVSGPSGVTELRGTSQLLPSGEFHVKTEHLKEGKWEPGHEVIYKEDAEAKVVFK